MSARKSQPLCYSYVRFSTPDQIKGNSLERQTATVRDWCERNGAILDASTTLHDLGKSAFTGAHRKNPDRHALASFLKLVESGKVPRGSYLAIENLDRLSREHIRPALTLLLNLIESGIRVVQMKPVEMVFDEDVEPMALMMAIMELSRGNSESKMKQERNGKAWQAKIDAARKLEMQPPRKKDGKVTRAITGQLPSWIEECGGKFFLIPHRAEVVKQIFALAASGYGMMSIVKKLTEDGVPAFGNRQVAVNEKGEVETVIVRGKERPRYRANGGGYGSGVWVRAYVARLLKDRRALGEHQPCTKGRKPDGEPIADFFPRVVTEAEWNAARAAMTDRKNKRGRIGKHVNVWQGLLRDARDGGGCHVSRSRQTRILVNTNGAEGRTTYWSFPADVFDEAILSMLRGIDPHDVLNGDEEPDEAQALAADFGNVEALIAELSAEIERREVAKNPSPTLYRLLEKKEAQQRQLAEQLAQANQRATRPLSASWGEIKSILEALESAPDPMDARLRLRSLIRRTVESVYLLVVPRGLSRWCVAQVRFVAGKGTRWQSYVIHYTPPQGNVYKSRPAKWEARALAEDLASVDLSDRKQAAEVEKIILENQ
jgi:DNA invertase Pin-like site-specific DNA recombinase